MTIEPLSERDLINYNCSRAAAAYKMAERQFMVAKLNGEFDNNLSDSDNRGDTCGYFWSYYGYPGR